MEYRRLGSSALSVGTIGMGTWRTFDVPPSDQEEVERRIGIVTEALSVGVNFYDSSPMYGHAEAILARCLENRRGRTLVATKVWTPDRGEGRKQIERALRYFSGHVDVYQIHNLVAWNSHLPVLRDLREDGKVTAIGITHYADSAFASILHVMETEDIQVIQIPYNAAHDLAAQELLPAAEALDIGVIVMSPLGTGQLTQHQPAADELKPFQRFGVTTWAQALLKWVVSDTRVSVTIPATSRSGRMTENAQAGEPPFFGPEERERVSWLARHALQPR